MISKISLSFFSGLLLCITPCYSSDDIKEELKEIQKSATSLATPKNKAGWESRRRDPRYNKLKRHSPREGEEREELLRKLSLPTQSPTLTRQLSLTPRAKSDTVSGKMEHPIIIKTTSDIDLRKALSRRSSSQPNTPRGAQGNLDQPSDNQDDDDPKQ